MLSLLFNCIDMLNNPAQAMRMLIVYAICIPLAVVMGYLLTDPLTYGTIGFVGILLVLLVSPVFIKWHYPIMVFGLGFPAICFFLPGKPPCWQIVVMVSFGIAIVERALNSKRRFLQATPMTWALLFTTFIAVLTMQLTGGFHLHAIGGEEGGGKKYINLYLGIATFFALISCGIPKEHRRLYIGLFFLSGIFTFISDLFPFLPAPLNYINLLFPPNWYLMEVGPNSGLMRFASLGNMATVVMIYMLARYGLRGILSPSHFYRALLFAVFFALSLTGGFRSVLFANVVILAFMFFLEGLHRTRWLALVLFMGLIAACIVVPFSRQMPESVQRSISFLPVEIDPAVRMDAEGSTDWRLAIWQAILPKVPEYLLLGKGYSLSSLDYESMGRDNPFAASAKANASLEGLAISNDFHSGPLSTVICFGIWGCLAILAIMAASLFIVYRNYRYGDPELYFVNALLFAMIMERVVHFFFIFGAFDSDVGWFAKYVGFSVALNWGICKPKPQPQPAAVPASQPRPLPAPAAPQAA